LVKRMKVLVGAEDADGLHLLVELVVRMLVSEAYRVYSADNEGHSDLDDEAVHDAHPQIILDERPYFEVLVVDAMQPREVDRLRDRLLEFRKDSDPFVYDVVVVPSYEDALIAALLNQNLQSVVIRYGFPIASKHSLGMAERALAVVDTQKLIGSDIGRALGSVINRLRPSLDLFLVSDANVEDLAGTHHSMFRRIFFRQEDLLELHQSLLIGVQERFETPFFTALKNYSLRPTGVFHALPIARGKSVSRSHWIRDMEDLYGNSLFMAETSATTGGLDSLLAPHGSLLDAQASAARAFGADRSFFVTNGTSTANKIVLQALTTPGDIVLATRDCHMSHHYAFVLCGAQPVYMDPYPLRQFGFYGGVPLVSIKRELLALKARGELSRARVLLLTNCTFDGIVYNPQKLMEEVLAIQPEMTFIWDEAWFAFAAFTPITRQRTAMASATALKDRLASAAYREEYTEWRTEFDASKNPDKWLGRLMADPDVAKVRVYATQSTHKTLTSLRQGSMIHIQDQDFDSQVAEGFHQAYLTHTSSSPNYPILASLDIGRRQVELEGYEMVHHAIELALVLRQRINSDPHLGRWFRVLTPEDLVPAEYRPSGFTQYEIADQVDWERMDDAWMDDEFCLDPSRITLFVGASGIDGDQFKRMLIDDFDIQVNKTSTNTVLFMTHIGTTRGAVAHLIDALSAIADDLDGEAESEGIHRAAVRQANRLEMTGTRAPLPNFSGFHKSFRDSVEPGPEGDMRRAFFLAVNEARVRYLKLDGSIQAALHAGQDIVAAAFITPYPPGFPVLVPGQLVSPEILAFLKSVQNTEIHGYDSELGLRLFTAEALA
jgi:arginine decarboxylase